MQSDYLTGIKLVVALDTTKMDLYNLILLPGKQLAKFIGSCSGGKWLEMKLYDSESIHIDAFFAIIESTTCYINEPFKGSDVTVAFTVFYPFNWHCDNLELASYGGQEVELLLNHFKRVYHQSVL